MKCQLLLKAEKTKVLLFLFLLLSLFCNSVLVSGKVFSEKSILLEFKNSVSDPSGILSSWSSTDNNNNPDHCSWFGVSCDSNSRVFSLNITGRGNCSEPLSCSEFSGIFPYLDGIRRTIRTSCCCCSSGGSGKLVGKLSPLVGKLTELRVLSLPCNGLSGDIPVEIWGLEKLEVVDLEDNLLTGTLPIGFLGLKDLRVLNLGFNRIEGEIPISFSKFVSLEVLNLAGNRLNGSIPGFLGSFMKLKEFYLSQNKLTGAFEEVFGDNNGCSSIEHLDVSGNFLVGQIPRSLGNCWRLRTLLLFSNMFGDVIPSELGRLQMLETLDVSRNSLSGPIPAELGHCVNLSVFVLSNLFDPPQTNRNSSGDSLNAAPKEYNYFEGSIPMEITTLPKLRIVWAPRANLEGKLPSNWGSCENLEMLNLAQNLFSGEISSVFERCKKLHFLDLSSNKLTGELDNKLPVPCMTFFDISGNLMSGPIPKFNYSVCSHLPSLIVGVDSAALAYMSFFTCKTRLTAPFPFSGARLVIHNFGGNNFTGPMQWLPIAAERLGKQTDYAFLAGGNKLDGLFPGSLFEKCDGLNGMIVNVSNNKFSGNIPLKIGPMCRSLQFLDASKNQISGSIPQSIGDSRSLVVLDLSENKLHGQITAGVSHLKHLKHLSVAGNNLTGTIPSSFARLRSLEVLELSSNSLSGEIPKSIANLRNLNVLLINNNKISGQIPSSLASVKSLSTFNASFNNLSGPFPHNLNVMNCSGLIGNPFLSSCPIASLMASSPATADNNGNSQANPGSATFSPIEIASITSASVIVLVLLALIVLFFFTRKWVPNSRVQVESRAIKVFTDIGVPLTFENIVQATGNFSNSNCIGCGGFGGTYKAEISPGIILAVKRLAVGRFQGVQQLCAEVNTLGRVRHPNLVTLIGFHAGETEMFLIYNYLPGGNLENFIKERVTRAVEWKILHKIALDIACALAYLHDEKHDESVPRVVHRDVKPSNILLDNDFNAYLSDFGLSRLLGTSETHATTGVAGTFGYVAPEYAMTCRVSEKADVYSYGVVLLELLSDKKALDPSFSSHGNGFNIVSWACMLLRMDQTKEFFTAGLWDAGPHDDLVSTLHLAVTCTSESLSDRPTMKQVVRRLKQLQPSSC